MRRVVRAVAFPLLSCSLAFGANGDTPRPADTILLNARIYTVDSAHPWAEALAIRDGKILVVGTDSEIGHYKGPRRVLSTPKDTSSFPGSQTAMCTSWKPRSCCSRFT